MEKFKVINGDKNETNEADNINPVIASVIESLKEYDEGDSLSREIAFQEAVHDKVVKSLEDKGISVPEKAVLERMISEFIRKEAEADLMDEDKLAA